MYLYIFACPDDKLPLFTVNKLNGGYFVFFKKQFKLYSLSLQSVNINDKKS